jgi:hypothetical protein
MEIMLTVNFTPCQFVASSKNCAAEWQKYAQVASASAKLSKTPKTSNATTPLQRASTFTQFIKSMYL